MKFLHTVLRVNDLDESITFHCNILRMKLVRMQEYPPGKFTLAFVGYGDIAFIKDPNGYKTELIDLTRRA